MTHRRLGRALRVDGPAASLHNLRTRGNRNVLRGLWRGRFLAKDFGPPALTVRRANSTVVVFDVFNTLITRTVIDPAEVQERMAARVSTHVTPSIDTEELLQARLSAESVVKERCGGTAVLEEIHDEMWRQLGRSGEIAVRSAKAEIAIEMEISRPITPGIELLEQARVEFSRVIFASDMHLPSQVIRSLLQRHGCWRDGDSLWVSAEAFARKRTGHLFEVIADVEGISIGEILHVGDDPVADAADPRWLGARAAPFRLAVPNRYERILARADAGSSLGRRLAGAAHVTRVSQPGSLSPAIADVATGVAGPFVVAYSMWLLKMARALDLDRLYFLSRDGEILLPASQTLVDRLGSGPELRYLYGGRLAWTLPATNPASDDQWGHFVDGLFMSQTRVTIGGLAMRLGLDPERLGELVGVLPSESLSNADRTLIRAHLMKKPLRETVSSYAAVEREVTIEYLRQEGFGADARCAVVDVGWGGNTMRSLAALLEGWTEPPLSLFAGYSGPASEPPGGVEAYLWHSQRTSSVEPSGLPSVIEMFCSGAHGPVVGYRRSASVVEPRLGVAPSIAATSWPLDTLHALVGEFVDNITSMVTLDDLEADTRSPIADVLRCFRDSPTYGEAELWGAFPREEGSQGRSVYPMARPFRLDDLPNIVRSGPSAGRNLTWPVAALTLTSLWLRPVFSFVLAVTAFLRRFRRLRSTR